jgi:hypothetical protein
MINEGWDVIPESMSTPLISLIDDAAKAAMMRGDFYEFKTLEELGYGGRDQR